MKITTVNDERLTHDFGMRKVMWNLVQAKSMFKQNVILDFKVLRLAEQNLFVIKITGKFNTVAFLVTSYRNKKDNHIRVFDSIESANRIIDKIRQVNSLAIVN